MESKKTLFVGDLHCKQEDVLPRVDALVESHGIGLVVLLGDYTDEWHSTAEDVLDAIDFQVSWLAEQAGRGIDVVCLLGNHDFEYLRIGGCTGTHHEAIFEIRESLSRIRMTAAAYVNGFLVTHAGLTQRWREENLYGCDDARACASRINELFLGEDPHDWKMLASAGRSRGGYGVPGPLWADAADLYMDEAHGIDQIIGHTPVASCERLDFIGEEIWLCDTLSLTSNMRPIGDGSALLLENGRALPCLCATSEARREAEKYWRILIMNDKVYTLDEIRDMVTPPCSRSTTWHRPASSVRMPAARPMGNPTSTSSCMAMSDSRPFDIFGVAEELYRASGKDVDVYEVSELSDGPFRDTVLAEAVAL